MFKFFASILKFFFAFVFFFAFCTTKLSALSSYGSPVIGASVGSVFASNGFNTKGVKESNNEAFDDEFFLLDERLNSKIFIGWQLIPNLITSFEMGYSGIEGYFTRIDNPGHVKFFDFIEFEESHIVARVDFETNIANNINFLFGTYGGLANLQFRGNIKNRLYRSDYKNSRYLYSDYKNFIFGFRTGFSYSIDDFMSLTLSHVFTCLPHTRDVQMALFNFDYGFSMQKTEILHHSVEFGFKWSFDAFD